MHSSLCRRGLETEADILIFVNAKLEQLVSLVQSVGRISIRNPVFHIHVFGVLFRIGQ